ncbi:MAG: UPF0489 family protein [Calditrichia bacterium]
MAIDSNLIKETKHLYGGCRLQAPVGNNAFSWDARSIRELWIPPFKDGTLEDVQPGKNIVFCEIEDGVERSVTGLDCLIYLQHENKDIFVVDNHNHAFYFWHLAIMNTPELKGLPVVHVDMHKDMREPEEYLPALSQDLTSVWKYTNYKLNVGNFIPPALKSGLISNVILVESSTDFEREMPDRFILDIDLDIFAPEMDYIDPRLKINRIREWMNQAAFVTIATSPYFIDQTLALEKLRELMSDSLF